MKYRAHIPTETYGFIEIELGGDAQDAVLAYRELASAWSGRAGDGLPHREFCKFIDHYIQNGSPPPDGLEQWERMDSRQRDVVNEFKKCLKRINK